MERRVALAGAVVLLLSAVVVVQIMDPQFEERTPPEVDFSEPPNEVAADAAKQFEHRDYAYRVDVANNPNEEWRQWVVTYVDHSNKSYRSVGPGGERETVIYGTTQMAFVRPTIDENWIVIGEPDVVYPVGSLTQPMNVERLRDSEAHVVSEDASMVTIHVDLNPLKIEGSFPGDAMLVVNRTTRMIESAHIAYKTNVTGTRYLKFEVVETETTVKRPREIEISPSEIFWDLLRGPLFRIEWLL